MQEINNSEDFNKPAGLQLSGSGPSVKNKDANQTLVACCPRSPCGAWGTLSWLSAEAARTSAAPAWQEAPDAGVSAQRRPSYLSTNQGVELGFAVFGWRPRPLH